MALEALLWGPPERGCGGTGRWNAAPPRGINGIPAGYGNYGYGYGTYQPSYGYGQAYQRGYGYGTYRRRMDMDRRISRPTAMAITSNPILGMAPSIGNGGSSDRAISIIGEARM